MKRIKKFVAVLLLSLTLFNSIFASYSMTVRAAEAIPVTMTALDAILSLFGVEIGLGNQFEFFSNQDQIQKECEAFLEAAANGQTYTMSSYGDVDFSNADSIYSWMNWAQKCNEYLSGNNIVDVTVDDSVAAVAKAFDKTSYSNTGTSATNAIGSLISDACTNHQEDPEQSLTDIQETIRMWYVIANMANSGGTGGDNGDDKPPMNSKRWALIGALMGALVYGASETIKDFTSSLRTPEESEYKEYDSAFLDNVGYSGSYSYYADSSDPLYESYANCYLIGYLCVPYGSYIYDCPVLSSSAYFSNNVFGYYNDAKTTIFLKYYDSNYNLKSVSITARYYNASKKEYVNFTSASSINVEYVNYLSIPLFNSTDDAKFFFEEGDTSGILNLVDDSAYPNFKKVAPSSYDTLSKNINKWMDTNPSVDSFPDAVSDILDASDSVVGTGDAVPAVDDAIAEKAGINTDSDTETDTGTSTNYMGILGKILNAILKLVDICNFFNNPLASILLNWQQLLQWLQDFKAWIENAWADLLEAIAGTGESKNPWGPVDDSGNGSSDSGTVNLLNGLLMLLSILYILLCIFLHLLEFIINIFKIPADPGFIEGDFAIGFEYIKTVQLSPLSISVYDFLMGLVHILLFFSIVKVLKRHIDKIHI